MVFQRAYDAIKGMDRIMGIVILVVILAVLGSAMTLWMGDNESFSPIDQWPYLPPKHWREREVTHWDPWYYRNGERVHPAVPHITNYSVQDYQFPARTLEMAEQEMPQDPMAEQGVPIALPTDGLSEEMAEDGNAESQGLGPTPESAMPQIPEEGSAEVEEPYGGGWGGARYEGMAAEEEEPYGGGCGGARYEGYGGARYEGMGQVMNTRNMMVIVALLLVGWLVWRNREQVSSMIQMQ